MSEYDELVALKRRLTDKRRQEYTPDGDKAVQVIERLERDQNEMASDLAFAEGARDTYKELLADARAEIERLKDTAREALQTLEAAAGRMPYGKRYDNVAARIIATQERVREALATPAPSTNETLQEIQKQMRGEIDVDIPAPSTGEAERQVVEAAMKWAATSSASRKKQFQTDLVDACQDLFNAMTPKAPAMTESPATRTESSGGRR